MGDSYRPHAGSHNDSGPRKRKRTENHIPQADMWPKSSDPPQNGGHDGRRENRSSQSYRPSRGRPNRDSWRPSAQRSMNSTSQQELPGEDDKDKLGQNSVQKRNRKSTRDRKENPSSKIHSLRNQIKRGTLPPPVQAEKERELSALLFEREKRNLRKESRRNLERYHFVRFMEKQKAQRTIKSLQKWEAAGLEQDDDGRDVKERLKEAEIDLNYTIYAPLGEKYISIFAEQRKGTQVSKAEKYKGNWKLFTPEERKFMDQKQVDELQKESMEAANVLEIFGNVPDGAGGDTSNETAKPPMWHEIKAAMEQGGGSKLEALRDRVRGNKKGHDLVVGLTSGNKRKLDWLDDNGEIDPADLDTGSDEDMVDMDSRTNITSKRENNTDRADDDDDMSDGDGGFFEKR